MSIALSFAAYFYTSAEKNQEDSSIPLFCLSFQISALTLRPELIVSLSYRRSKRQNYANFSWPWTRDWTSTSTVGTSTNTFYYIRVLWTCSSSISVQKIVPKCKYLVQMYLSNLYCSADTEYQNT